MEAKSARTTREGRSETVCPGCLERFQGDDGAPRTPLMLVCGHTVCRSCLVAIAARDSAQKQPPKAVVCPVCRQPTALPESGDVTALSKNFALIEQLKEHSGDGDAAPVALCDGCEKEPATMFCPQCRWQFCCSCDERMHGFAVMQDHKRVPASERSAVEELRCPQHRKKLQLYCKNCRVLCCAFCEKSTAHKGHEVVLRDEAVADYESGMKADLERLRNVVRMREREAELLQKATERLSESYSLVREQLDRELAALKAAVERRERELRAQLQGAFKPEMERFKTHQDETAAALSNARSVLEAGTRTAGQRVQNAVQLNAALCVWQEVREAIAGKERSAVIEPKKAAWSGTSQALCDSVAGFGLVYVSGDAHSVSFRDGPNYTVSGPHRNIITKTGGGGSWNATAVGDQPFPRGCKTRWAVRIIRSATGNIMIGVAPPTINQGAQNNHTSCGWYFYVCNSTLYSGPPQSYNGRAYGNLSGRVANNSIIEVEVDTEHGTLSFIVNGRNGGVAYEGLPADFVPVVLFCNQNDAVEAIWQ